MTIEAMWYAGYDDEGNAPRCNRLIRTPAADQLGVAFELALDLMAGRAGYRSVGEISTTGETYWWWPRERPGRKYGDWWMLPARTIRLMERATDYARARPRRSDDRPYGERVAIELRRLLRRAYRARRYVQREGVELPGFSRIQHWNKLRKLKPRPDSWRALKARGRRAEIIEQYGPRGYPW